MWAVIHCLKTWGHYIGSKDVAVWTDNVTLKYFATQPKLSSRMSLLEILSYATIMFVTGMQLLVACNYLWFIMQL
jgi:hypothetical protein